MEVYLDHSATTRQYQEVTGRMVEVMNEDYGNPSSLHHRGVTAEQRIKEARKQVAGAMGVASGTLIFTSGGTESDNMAIWGLCRARKHRGRHIVTTAIEHPAVLETCHALEQDGFSVIEVGVDENGKIRLDELQQAVDEKTVLVSCMQVNNEVGTIQPVNQVARCKAGAVLHTDCVQSFGKIPLPIRDADFISVSGHKIHGPKGIGALWIRDGIHFLPLIHGGGQEQGLRSGTENTPAIAGFGLAAELTARRRKHDAEQISRVREFFMRGILDQIPDVRMNTPWRESVPNILNVSFLGTRGEVLLHTLEQDGIYVSTGSACSSHQHGQSHVLLAMGRSQEEIEGAIRFSFDETNSCREMEIVLDRLKHAVSRFRRLGTFR